MFSLSRVDYTEYFKLIVCIAPDFDLCQQCYDKDPTEHEVEGHQFNHTMALVAAFLQESRRIWIYHQNEHELERSHAEMEKVQTPQSSDKSDHDEENELRGMHTSNEEEPCGESKQGASIDAPRPLVDFEKEKLYACCVCRSLVTLESRFFICGEYSCRGTFTISNGWNQTADCDAH